jgi:hypothetical protein
VSGALEPFHLRADPVDVVGGLAQRLREAVLEQPIQGGLSSDAIDGMRRQYRRVDAKFRRLSG